MKEIQTIRNHIVMVDDDDYEWLSKYRWYFQAAKSKRTVGYIHGLVGGRLTVMHRLIMGALPGQQVDHKNGYGLYNQRGNLRLCTASQNIAAIPSRGRATGYRGVKPQKGKYVGIITVNQKRYRGPAMACPIEAARWYDRMAIENFGEFAVPNFPNSSNAIPREQA